jgi:hypothetical protein
MPHKYLQDMPEELHAKIASYIFAPEDIVNLWVAAYAGGKRLYDDMRGKHDGVRNGIQAWKRRYDQLTRKEVLYQTPRDLHLLSCGTGYGPLCQNPARFAHLVNLGIEAGKDMTVQVLDLTLDPVHELSHEKNIRKFADNMHARQTDFFTTDRQHVYVGPWVSMPASRARLCAHPAHGEQGHDGTFSVVSLETQQPILQVDIRDMPTRVCILATVSPCISGQLPKVATIWKDFSEPLGAFQEVTAAILYESTGDGVRDWSGTILNNSANILTMKWSPDGRYLATCYDRSVQHPDVNRETILRVYDTVEGCCTPVTDSATPPGQAPYRGRYSRTRPILQYSPTGEYLLYLVPGWYVTVFAGSGHGMLRRLHGVLPWGMQHTAPPLFIDGTRVLFFTRVSDRSFCLCKSDVSTGARGPSHTLGGEVRAAILGPRELPNTFIVALPEMIEVWCASDYTVLRRILVRAPTPLAPTLQPPLPAPLQVTVDLAPGLRMECREILDGDDGSSHGIYELGYDGQGRLVVKTMEGDESALVRIALF